MSEEQPAKPYRPPRIPVPKQAPPPPPTTAEGDEKTYRDPSEGATHQEGEPRDTHLVRVGSRRESVTRQSSASRDEMKDMLQSVALETVQPAAPARREAAGPPKVPVARTTRTVAAFFHIVKGNVGAGIFLLPMTYNNAGYVMGPILALGTGYITIDATLMLVKRKTAINDPDVQTYAEVVDNDFGENWSRAVTAALVTTQLGYCTMYLQFSSGLFLEIFPYISYLGYIILCVAIVTPLTWIEHLSKLAPASAAATACLVFCLVSVLGFVVPQISEADETLTVAVAPISRWATFIAANCAVLEGIGVVLPIENAMKRPKQFPALMRGTVGGCVIFYFFFALLCYLPYGTNLTSSIVHALPPSWFSKLVQFSLATSLLLSYPLQYLPAIQLLDVSEWSEGGHVWRMRMMRLAINVWLGCMAAMVGPETLGLVLALMGSTAASFLALIVPPLLAIAHEPRKSPEWYRCAAYICFGVFVSVVGTIQTLRDVESALSHSKPNSGVFVPNATDVVANFTAIPEVLTDYLLQKND